MTVSITGAPATGTLAMPAGSTAARATVVGGKAVASATKLRARAAVKGKFFRLPLRLWQPRAPCSSHLRVVGTGQIRAGTTRRAVFKVLGSSRRLRSNFSSHRCLLRCEPKKRPKTKTQACNSQEEYTNPSWVPPAVVFSQTEAGLPQQ